MLSSQARHKEESWKHVIANRANIPDREKDQLDFGLAAHMAKEMWKSSRVHRQRRAKKAQVFTISLDQSFLEKFMVVSPEIETQ